MKVTHHDLFAGIGGFSYALDTVFHEEEIEHIFCEWEAFPTAVLKKHWPDATYYGDIADLVADTNSQRWERERKQDEGRHGLPSGETSDKEQVVATITPNTNSKRVRDGFREVQKTNGEVPKRDNHAEFSNSDTSNELTILTGGFPCQPFSHAGRRKGTSDDRYKWPEMFAVIRNVRPDWVIAENVRGLASWNDGMVLETVCADLEAEGYEVRPFIIPAVAVGAPHRRDRVWIVAHSKGADDRGNTREFPQSNEQQTEERQEERTAKPSGAGVRQWEQDWREVALATCHDGVDDGLPRKLDGATYRGKRTDCISAAQHRKERLKACGNAIVPQVAMELFKAIKENDKYGCGK